MTRNFTRSEATAFLSAGFHADSAECLDDGKTLEFSEVGIDRDGFDLELKFFAFENDIPLDFDVFTYAENDTGVLTVGIPYTKSEGE